MKIGEDWLKPDSGSVKSGLVWKSYLKLVKVLKSFKLSYLLELFNVQNVSLLLNLVVWCHMEFNNDKYIGLGLNAINGYHSAMVINHNVVTTK